MPVSEIKIRRSPGSKRIFSSAVASCQLLHGGPILKTSAQTRVTPICCAAWDSSREQIRTTKSELQLAPDTTELCACLAGRIPSLLQIGRVSGDYLPAPVTLHPHVS